MFERFTDRARRVLVLAQEEASLLQHNFIGTEHLLLGILSEGETIAAQILVEDGLELDKVRKLVAETVGPADAYRGTPPFTPRTKKALELCLRESLQLGQNYIGVEHMVLGLIRVGEGLAVEIMVKEGRKDLSEVRRLIIDRLTHGVEEYCSVKMTTRERQEMLEWIGNFDQTNGPLAKRHVLARIRERLNAS